MDKKNIAVSNLIWRFMERAGAQIVSFVVSIVLARILVPEQYGIVAIATVVISFLNVFADSGLGNALIQSQEADEEAFSTVFWGNLLISIVLYILLYLSAPILAEFYSYPQLTTVLRVMGITIIISSVKNIQQVYVTKNMMFKKFFFSTLGGTLISAIVGICIAIKGGGIWALAVQYLVNVMIDTMILSLVIDWKPRFAFSGRKLQQLFGFGYKLLVSSLINCLYENIRQLIVGKMYSSVDLAFYNRGKQMPSILITNINTSIDSVLFPLMSEEQNDRQKIKEMAKRSMATSSFVLSPLLFGLASVSNHLIPLIMTEKWVDCVPYVVLFCVLFAFFPIQTTNLNIVKALGKSDVYLKLEILQIVVGTSLLLIGVKQGTMVIAIMYLVATIINTIAIMIICGKYVGFSFNEELRTVAPYYVMAIIMSVVTWYVGTWANNHFFAFVQIIVGVGIYLLENIIVRPESFRDMVNEIEKRSIKIK